MVKLKHRGVKILQLDCCVLIFISLTFFQTSVSFDIFLPPNPISVLFEIKFMLSHVKETIHSLTIPNWVLVSFSLVFLH